MEVRLTPLRATCLSDGSLLVSCFDAEEFEPNELPYTCYIFRFSLTAGWKYIQTINDYTEIMGESPLLSGPFIGLNGGWIRYGNGFSNRIKLNTVDGVGYFSYCNSGDSTIFAGGNGHILRYSEGGQEILSDELISKQPLVVDRIADAEYYRRAAQKIMFMSCAVGLDEKIVAVGLNHAAYSIMDARIDRIALPDGFQPMEVIYDPILECCLISGSSDRGLVLKLLNDNRVITVSRAPQGYKIRSVCSHESEIYTLSFFGNFPILKKNVSGELLEPEGLNQDDFGEGVAICSTEGLLYCVHENGVAVKEGTNWALFTPPVLGL